MSLTLPLRYFGSVSHYAMMSAFGHVVIDDTARFDKRKKDVHRTTIVDTRGKLMLTVPVTHGKPLSDRPTWNDTAISTHGEWWNIHLTSLASAYGRTPYFEFYIDRLRRFFDKTTPASFESIAALDRAADAVVRDILGFDNTVIYKSESNAVYTNLPGNGYTIPPSNNGYANPSNNGYANLSLEPAVDIVAERIRKNIGTEYYQVRRDKLGFHADLSILDLIFNLGPEAPLYLSHLTK